MQLAFLEAVPQLATHPACAPFCLRFLQPLAAAGSTALFSRKYSCTRNRSNVARLSPRQKIPYGLQRALKSSRLWHCASPRCCGLPPGAALGACKRPY